MTDADPRDEGEFVEEVGAFVDAHLSREVRRKVAAELRLSRPEMSAWQRRLHERGWAAPSWPREHGGTGWSLRRQYLFRRATARAHAPDLPPFGLQMIGPLLYTFGSPEQRDRYLPGILTGETWWCQGFSEPGAGSDLASLRTRARLDGDHYVVTGQKIWTSLAHMADLMFCLVRTQEAGKPQLGLSMLIFEMTAPGVTVRPIVTLDGHHHLNEVFLDEVRVPRENVVGEAGQGWTHAKFLLGNERLGIANIPRLRRRLATLLDLAAAPDARGLRWLSDPGRRREIAAFETDLLSLEEAELAALERAAAGHPERADASILKVAGTELLQRGDALLAKMIGPEAAILATDADRLRGHGDETGDETGDGGEAAARASVMPALLHGRAASIYGGSNEVQRNIVANAWLGVPPRSA